MIKTKLVLIALLLLSGITLLATISKVLAKNTTLSSSNQNAQVQEIEVKAETTVPSPTLKPTVSVKPTSVPRAVLTPKPTSTPISPSNNSNLCLITLFGQQYDVTSLRSSHSGGDVFKCGTDMTALYQGQHGASLVRMQPYLYLPGSTTVSTRSPISDNNLKSEKSDDSDDREDKKNEDRYVDD